MGTPVIGSTRVRNRQRVIDIDHYVPYFFATINNALSRGASRLYLERFGIGIVEWRVMSMLAIEPQIPAARICEVIALDKGATSRALERLDRAGYLSHSTLATDPRRRLWQLNPKGYKLHDQVLEIALKREARLLDGVDPDDLLVFLRVMRIMRKNVEAL